MPFNHCFIALDFSVWTILATYISLCVLGVVCASKWTMETNGAFVCPQWNSSKQFFFKKVFAEFSNSVMLCKKLDKCSCDMRCSGQELRSKSPPKKIQAMWRADQVFFEILLYFYPYNDLGVAINLLLLYLDLF